MNLYSFRLEVSFADEDTESPVDIVVGAGLIGQYGLMWPSLEE